MYKTFQILHRHSYGGLYTVRKYRSILCIFFAWTTDISYEQQMLLIGQLESLYEWSLSHKTRYNTTTTNYAPTSKTNNHSLLNIKFIVVVYNPKRSSLWVSGKYLENIQELVLSMQKRSHQLYQRTLQTKWTVRNEGRYFYRRPLV